MKQTLLWKKLIAQVLAGLILGIFFFAFGLVTGASYGGNFGCFSWIDRLFGTAGYESCGAFFSFIGLIFGLVVGISICRCIFLKTKKRATIIIGGSAGILGGIFLLVGYIGAYKATDGNFFMFYSSLGILTFFVLVCSMLITLFLNRKVFVLR